MKTYSQAGQDCFVLACLKSKRNGSFLEIGSNHPIIINNTYQLEKDYGWRGLMIEYDPQWEPHYRSHRVSDYLIQDATTIDFTTRAWSRDIDYLQIDLDVTNRSTLTTLEHLDDQFLNNHRFAVITFEHDIYNGNHFDTRQISRAIFDKRGYVRVFSDVQNEGNAFEDWYVHPDLVDMNYIQQIKRDDSIAYTEILKLL